MYIGSVVAVAAVVAGFGAAVLIYGPIGSPYRQLSGTTLGAPPTGVVFGNAAEEFTSALNLSNATGNGQSFWNWTQGGPCNQSGILNNTVATPGYSYYDTNSTATNFNITSGSVVLVCLNSVTPITNVPGVPGNGTLNATWYFNASGAPLVSNSWNSTGGMGDGSYFNNTFQNVSSCNSWTAPGALPSWESPWNLTHINNASFVPCNTYYEMNNITNFEPTFNSTTPTAWVSNESGYMPDDVVYTLPVIFTNTSVNGTYQISVSIAGVTPVAQTFFFNNENHGGAYNATVLFVFDMTAAWLYDASVNMTGAPNPSITPEIYGAIGTASAIITECSGTGVCPDQSSALVAGGIP